MKNFILALIVCACCSVSFGGECRRQPVRNLVGSTVGSTVNVVGSTVGATVSVAERVVSTPVRVVRRVFSGVQCRRQARRCCR